MNLKEYSISPISIMLFIHIIALSNFFQSELSQGFKNYIENSVVTKQLIIFLIILTIISQVYSNESLINVLLLTVTIYFLLLFITNSDYRIHVGIFVLLTVFNLYQNYVKQKQKQELSDPRLDPEYKKKLIDENYKVEKYIYAGIIGIIIFGALYYERKKRKQFGEKFSLSKFLFNYN
jgi:hypothetical protein